MKYILKLNAKKYSFDKRRKQYILGLICTQKKKTLQMCKLSNDLYSDYRYAGEEII